MIFLGNGDGTFAVGDTYSVAVQPFYAAAASLRNNGILDLVVEDSGSDDVFVLLGNGDGTFQAPVPYPVTAESYMIGLGDFTGKGKIDILSVEECNCVDVLPGNGDGTFGSAITTALPYGMSGYAVTSGDFNQDGKLDVAVVGESLPNWLTAILLGNGDGTFRADGYYLVSEEPISVATGRFNGDNRIDLAVATLLGNTMSVLLGNGGGSFQEPVNYDTWYPSWVAVGDLNGDGKQDLVASNGGSPGNTFVSTVSVLLGNGDGTFQAGVEYPAGKTLNYVAIGDFNGDGKPDLVAVDQLGDAVITLLNTGLVTFSPTTPLTFPTQLLGTSANPLTATLTNNGSSALTISSVSSSGKPFKVQTTCKGSISPGADCTVTANFNAEAIGATTGTVTIKDSASSKPQVVELIGTGTEVKPTPAQLTFPPQKKGTMSPAQQVRVTNIGSAAFDFTYKIYVGTNGSLTEEFYETNNCPTSLAAGASCTIHVTFAPRQTGAITGDVVLTDTGGGSPQLVPLSGTGD